MKRIITFTLFLSLVLPFLVVSQTSSIDPKSIVGNLKEKYGPEKAANLAFDLTIFWSVRERYEKKSGELIYSPGEKFRLTLGNTSWVSNGQTYWQYSKKTNQVVIKSLLDIDLSLHPSSMMQSFLSYTFSTYSSDDKTIVLKWEGDSKNSDLPYKKIVINVDRKKMEISELTVIDDDGNESRYTFKKAKFGGAEPASIFEFSIPEGVDVLDTRK